MGLADFARVAAGELDVTRALLDGRADLDGPMALASRLGDMFGAPSVF
jgi:putative sterol carrier protein